MTPVIEQIVHKENGLSYPSGLAYDQEDHVLYIVDMRGKRVRQLDLDRKSLWTIRDERGVIAFPLAITLYKEGLLVTDTKKKAILQYTKSRWGQFEIDTGNERPLQFPGSIAADESGNVYVADFTTDRICRIDGNTRKLTVLRDIRCHQPYGIFVRHQTLYVTDTGNKRILQYDLRMRTLLPYCEGISSIAVAVHPNGRIYVSENRKLYQFDPRSKSLSLLLDASAWKRFSYPKLCHIGSLCVQNEADLIFTDTIKNTVYRLSLQQ